MKEETKELLVRIKVVLNNYVTQSFNKEELKERNEFCNKAVQFLDSLPEKVKLHEKQSYKDIK